MEEEADMESQLRERCIRATYKSWTAFLSGPIPDRCQPGSERVLFPPARLHCSASLTPCLHHHLFAQTYDMDFSNFNSAEQAHLGRVIERKQVRSTSFRAGNGHS
jgi:hypothetical protein